MEKKIATKPQLRKTPKGRWYIYYSVRNPETGKLVPQKIEKGFSEGTIMQKKKHADKLIREITRKLKAGWLPWKDPESVYEDEINYQHENQSYSKKRKSNNTIRRLLSDFLAERKLSLKKKSYQTYQSRMRVFHGFIIKNKLDENDITAIDNKVILKFFQELIEKKQLDKRSVNNYKIILSMFFNSMIEKKRIYKSPVYNIPLGEKTKDNAPSPILPPDLEVLLQTIEKKDKQLYLACLMQYFCAIRPGLELRTLQVKHINFWAKTITIKACYAKNSRERIIAIPEQFYNIITRVYKLQAVNRDYFIFSRNREPGTRQIGINSLRVRFNEIRDELGLSKDYKLYSLKHTGAGFLLDKGEVTIKDLQAHLGHADINSTFQYIRKYRGQTNEKIRNNFPDPFPNFEKQA
ncbi:MULTISPECIES: tyrosine-type recombinase/integrase [Sanguibacteroides]|uniref:Integrase n=1 Tax=Sanguibacteroides justesenii TaxID=1547597 RepID=A0AB34R724_9PORP|nr:MULTISPECIES: tyrosine-type recombinase/integrase [Sanguibacteroides]KIO45481.1 hypothetical protein IE90_08745 [Sanguibacteroides justesenii]